MNRRLAIVSLVLLLSACSSTTFFYNRLDFLIPWYMGRYVDLDREQSVFLDEQLLPFLAWHRNEELPRYLELLDQAEEMLAGPVAADDIARLSLAAEDAWLRVEQRGLEWMIELGAQLSDEQMAEFIDELRKRQLKYEKKYLTRSDEEYREDALDNLRDSLQDYLGRLEPSQRDALEVYVARLIRSDSVWLEERASWIDRLDAILQRESGWQQRLREAIRTREETVSEAYTTTYNHNLAVINEAVAETLNTRTDKQDRRLRREIEDLRDDLKVLIEQGRVDSDAA
jgi:hypothetical protein